MSAKLLRPYLESVQKTNAEYREKGNEVGFHAQITVTVNDMRLVLGALEAILAVLKDDA